MRRSATLALGLLLCLGSASHGAGVGSLVGDWTAVRADCEELSFKWYKAQLEFSSFLHRRPFDSGEWDLRGDSLFLYGASGTGRYLVSLKGDTLELAAGKEKQVFVRREEWRELLIYGTHTASSTLNGEDWFGENVPAYSVRNLGDGNPATCWAEGASGPGIGEKIYLVVNGKPKSLAIINGYGKSKSLFEKNGRVKAFRATVLAAFNLPGDVSEVDTIYHVRICGPTVGLEIKDFQAKQSIILPFDWTEIERKGGELEASFESDFAARIADRSHGCQDRFYRAVILELEISEVYKGARYEDACISELSLE